MPKLNLVTRRALLTQAGFLGATSGLWSQAILGIAGGEEPKATEAVPVSKSRLLLGLDAMGRCAESGANPFVDGHRAAAVISAGFFAREQALDEPVQSPMRVLVEKRLVKTVAPFAAEKAEPELVESLVKELDTGIDTLRRAGHNIIFAVTSLKALREVPEFATPARIDGLRAMVRRFGTNKEPHVSANRESFVDLSDEQKFIAFVMEEYLKALDLYLNGKGHHGFAGHLLTMGHALVELAHMGHKETAYKGVEAYWRFVEQARVGANLGGKKIEPPAIRPPTPLTTDYWARQGARSAGEIVSSHLIKYPYSFYALAKLLRDESLKQRVLERIQFLSAVT